MSRATKVDPRLAFVWATQLVASLSWFIAVLVYDSYEHGDGDELRKTGCSLRG